MSLKNQEIKVIYAERYGIEIAVDENGERDLSSLPEMAVYKTDSTDKSHWQKKYIVGPEKDIYSTVIGGRYEVLVCGEHTLLDADDVYTEFTGE
jgi:hypothetical protein